MIKYEKPDYDDEVAIPLSLVGRKGFENTVTAYEGFEDEAKRLEHLNPTEPDKQTLLEVTAGALIKIKKHEFSFCEEESGVSTVYITDGIDESNILDGTRMLTEDDVDEEGYDSLMTYYDEDYPSFGFIEDGKVVSIAQTNPTEDLENSPFNGFYEVGVETLPGYFGKGYALSCLAALVKHLKQQGKNDIMYICSVKNKASVRVAEKAEMKAEGIMYFCVCEADR